MCYDILLLMILLLLLLTQFTLQGKDQEYDQDQEQELQIGHIKFGSYACADRSVVRKDSSSRSSFSSRRFVQSHAQQAHASVPFSCRQLRRECASFTRSSSKYS